MRLFLLLQFRRLPFAKGISYRFHRRRFMRLTILQRMSLRNKNKRSDMEDIRENLIRLEAKESVDTYLACVEVNMKYKF